MSPSMKTRSVTTPLLAALLLLLTACASVPEAERGTVDAEDLNEDEGIVFGVLEPQYYDSKGKRLSGRAVPEIEYEVYYGAAESLSVRRAFSGFAESIRGNMQQPQTFFSIRLPADEYSIFRLQRRVNATRGEDQLAPGPTGFIPLDVRFTVAPGRATYIGSLQIEFRAGRGLLGTNREDGKVSVKVVDDAADATRKYKERNPNAGQTIATGLMKARRP